jgi:hypothetical protein
MKTPRPLPFLALGAQIACSDVTPPAIPQCIAQVMAANPSFTDYGAVLDPKYEAMQIGEAVSSYFNYPYGEERAQYHLELALFEGESGEVMSFERISREIEKQVLRAVLYDGADPNEAHFYLEPILYTSCRGTDGSLCIGFEFGSDELDILFQQTSDFGELDSENFGLLGLSVLRDCETVLAFADSDRDLIPAYVAQFELGLDSQIERIKRAWTY